MEQSTNNSGNSYQEQQANNAGNSQYMVTNYPKNTPSTALFVPAPTSICQQTIGVSGMMPGMGLSISGSYTNENCERLEVAKALASIGQLHASLEIICSSKHANVATVCRDINAKYINNTITDNYSDMNHPNPWIN